MFTNASNANAAPPKLLYRSLAHPEPLLREKEKEKSLPWLPGCCYTLGQLDWAVNLEWLVRDTVDETWQGYMVNKYLQCMGVVAGVMTRAVKYGAEEDKHGSQAVTHTPTDVCRNLMVS